MIKKCRVLLNNDAVTVIKFGNKEIQIPAIKRNADYVNVSNESGKYTVVSDTYKEKEIKKTKQSVKETTKEDEIVDGKKDEYFSNF